MSLSAICAQIPNYYFVSILNSNILFNYYRTFINCSVNIQINDIRMLPVIIPTHSQLQIIEPLFRRAVGIRKRQNDDALSLTESEAELSDVEHLIDKYVDELYSVDTFDQ
jgi:hypothetical protein